EDCTERERTHAYQVGQLLAQAGATVLCGGGHGVMAAVAAGVRAHDGVVIAILPGDSRADVSSEVSTAVVTNMGQARNAILVWSADAVVAVGGSWGTLSEVALAMRRGDVPVISLGGWSIHDAQGDPVGGILTAATPQKAVELALQAP
nr:LOG family protein [Longispora sp. (in: high G+C Gram-positive bacteria)]